MPPTPPKIGDHIDKQYEAMRIIALGFGAALILLAIFAGVKFTGEDTETSLVAEEAAIVEEVPEEITLLKEMVRFPDFTNYRVYVDPYEDQLWVGGYTSLYTLDLATGAVEEYTDRVNPEGLGITSIARVGDDLLLGLRGGVMHYSLSSETSVFLTEDDGIPSESNIVINADPYNPNEVWIGTFEGLARYTLSNGNIRTIFGGRGVQPRVFAIDDEAVWVTVGANAYYSGGVERIDKNTLARTTWTTADFTEGDYQPNNRLDAEGWVSSGGETLLVREDTAIYEYDRISGQWQHRFTQERGSGERISYVYAIEDGVLHAYISDGDIVGFSLVDGSEVFRKPVSYSLIPSVLVTDAQDGYRRFSVSRDGVYGQQSLSVYSPELQAFTPVTSLAAVSDFAPLSGVRVLDVSNGEILLRQGGQLHVYRIETGEIHTFETTDGLSEGVIVSGGYIVHEAEYCDGMCFENVPYYATTTLYSNTDFSPLASATFHDPEMNYMDFRVDPATEDVLLRYSGGGDLLQVFRFEQVTGTYVKDDPYRSWSSSAYQDPKKPKRFEPQYGTSSVSYLTRQQGPYFEVQVGNEEVMISTKPILFPIDPDDGFTGGYPWFDVTDPAERGAEVWFGTDFGIAVLDLPSQTVRFVGVEDGLFNKHINDLWLTDDFLVVSHSPYANDVVVYRLP